MARLRKGRTEEEKKKEREKDKMRKRRVKAVKIVKKREMEGTDDGHSESNTFETKVQMEMDRRAKEMESEATARQKWMDEYEKSKKEEFETWCPVVYERSSGIHEGPQFAIVKKSEWTDGGISRISIKV